MSNLRIKTRSGLQANPEFVEMFLAIADEKPGYPAVIELTCIDSVIFHDLISGEDSKFEGTDIQNMAVFMLLSGAVLGVKWGEFYYFGDVDRMDNEFNFDENMDDVTLLQYELEDEPSLPTLIKTFREVNSDCMRDGDDSIPFTDKEYYSEQIQTIYNLPEKAADELADQMRKFTIFQTSGKDVENIGQYSDDWEGPVCPGRVYLADSLEKCGLVMSDTSHWANAKNIEGKWYLQIGNQEWISDNLEELEFELFDFAISAGWTDDL